MADRSGQQLGNYRLMRLLGKGGFAEVYFGEHVYLNTPVAVKVLHTQLISEDMGSFLKEAQTIAYLVHPHIVRVTDFGVDNGTPFLVMDYASNGTLRQRHPKGSILSLATIIPYVKQVADALQYAHNLKLIHRDIKPENMLLGRHNEVLLSDFGTALMPESSRYQNAEEVVGTVAYMSPEQIQGRPHPASDQYSLAIVLYEWLSGDRPFRGSITEVCTQHMFASPPSLRERIPALSPDVERVVTIALAKDPRERFINIMAFANALEQSQQSEVATFVRPWPRAQLNTPVPQAPYIPSLERSSNSFPVIASSKPGNSYAAEPERIEGEAEQEGVKVWSIGKKQIAGMVSGAIVFAALLFLSSFFDLISFANMASIALAWAALLFWGTAFGSWVGLFTGGGGMVIVGILQNQRIFDFFFWKVDLGFALAGFIAGLALLMTKGRYNNFQAIATAGGTSIIAAFIGIYIAYFPGIGMQDLFSYGIVPSLILLPLLLAAYSTLVSRRKGT